MHMMPAFFEFMAFMKGKGKGVGNGMDKGAGKGYGMDKGVGKGKDKGKKFSRPKPPGGDGGKYKLELNNAVLKIVPRDAKAEDIVYQTEQVQGGLQSQVTISVLPNHMANMLFAGEVCPTEKEAVDSAAMMALQSIMADPELKALYDAEKAPKIGADGLPKPTKEERKRKREEEGIAEVAATAAQTPKAPGVASKKPQKGVPLVQTNKVELNNAVLKIVPRDAKKEDIVYSTQEVQGGFQAEVIVNVLPNDMKSNSFVGEVCLTEQEAEQNCAAVALAAILADPELKALHDAKITGIQKNAKNRRIPAAGV